MRGMKLKDLVAIIDFLYCGEATVFQENLDSFLSIAQDLELKGFMGHGNDFREIEKRIIPEPVNKQMDMKPETCVQKKPFNEDREKHIFKKQSQSPRSEKGNARREDVSNLVSGYLQELDERVKSMMEGVKTGLLMEKTMLLFVTSVERKDIT